MGLKIVPHDGLFSALSTFSDTMLLIDASREEFIEWYLDRQAIFEKQSLMRDLEMLDKGHTHQFSRATLLEILETHIPEQVEGDEAAEWNALIAKRLEEEKAKAKDTE